MENTSVMVQKAVKLNLGTTYIPITLRNVDVQQEYLGETNSIIISREKVHIIIKEISPFVK